MKKQVKILTTILMIIVVMATIGNVVLAANETKDGGSGTVSGLLDGFDPNNKAIEATDKIQSLGETIVNILQILGIVVAIVVLSIIGIKYMMGSAEEKAEYKKVMVPYVVGAIIIFAATSLVKVVYKLATGVDTAIAG